MPILPVATPTPLKIAALFALTEAVAFVVLAVIQVVSYDAERATLGLTTTAFFVLWAGMLALCAVAVARGSSVARSPLVLAQLLQLGVAWSFAQGDAGSGDKAVAWFLAAAAVAVLVGLFHPKSIRFLAADA